MSYVLEFSLHCSSSSAGLEIVWYMVSFTFRYPKGVPCVVQVRNDLSHDLIISIFPPLMPKASCLSRLRIQDPMFVFRAIKNSTISFQDFLGVVR